MTAPAGSAAKRYTIADKRRIIERVCVELEAGASVNEIFRSSSSSSSSPGGKTEKLPERATVYHWLADPDPRHDELRHRYARAVESCLEQKLMETIDAEVDLSGDPRLAMAKVQLERLRAGNRQWLAERLLPRYAPRQRGLDLGSGSGGPVVLQIVVPGSERHPVIDVTPQKKQISG